MCGIIGIASTKKRDIVPELIDSLVRLEYRGYDSAGIACDLGGDILIEKCTGAPSDGLSAEGIYKQTVIENLECSTGIGHNRWATHGKPTVQNAHPHFDTKREVIVVHNGTILNFEILKSELEKNGVVFATETDTEVIPQYISKLLKEGESIEDAFLNTIKKLEGSFGVVMMAKSNPGKLYIAKNGSPVVIGITDDSYFVSSSIHAFAPYTDRYITVEDNEYVLLDVTNDNPEIKILHLENKNKREAVEKRMENKEEGIYSKGEYETFMLKEIYEQIATTKVTLLGRYDEKKGDIHLGGLLEHREFLSKIDHLQFIACGTAYNAASVGAYLIEQLTSLQASAHIASEFRHRHNRSPKETTAIFAVSQSGETADTLECVKAANKKGYNTFGIINVVGSAIASEVSAGVYTRAGTEIGVASTKAFTSQLAVIYLLAVYFATSRDMSQKESAAFAGELDRIPELMRRALDENIEKIKKLANEFSKAKSVSFLGKGVHVPIAAEAQTVPTRPSKDYPFCFS